MAQLKVPTNEIAHENFIINCLSHSPLLRDYSHADKNKITFKIAAFAALNDTCSIGGCDEEVHRLTISNLVAPIHDNIYPEEECIFCTSHLDTPDCKKCKKASNQLGYCLAPSCNEIICACFPGGIKCDTCKREFCRDHTESGCAKTCGVCWCVICKFCAIKPWEHRGDAYCRECFEMSYCGNACEMFRTFIDNEADDVVLFECGVIGCNEVGCRVCDFTHTGDDMYVCKKH